jgi:hypothetical protein
MHDEMVHDAHNAALTTGQGVSTPGCICTLYLKRILNIFKNVRKIQIKILCVYLDMLHAYKVVSAKTDMFHALCKKDKS